MTCGECKHLSFRSNKYGSCDASVPLWARWALEEIGNGTVMQLDQDASSCPCFERKEASRIAPLSGKTIKQIIREEGER